MNFAKLFSSFQKQSPESLKQINSGKVKLGNLSHSVGQEAKEIVLRLAQDLDLDEVQCFEIYWKFQRETTQKLLLNDQILKTKVEISNKAENDEQYNNVKKFYWQERISTIEMVSAILRAAQDENHTYYKVCRESAHFIVKCTVDGVEFKKFVLDLLVATAESKISLKLETNPAEAVKWSKQNLLEQKCLLSLAILVYYNHYPTPKEAYDAISTCLKLGFGVLQVNRPFFDNTLLDIYQAIRDLHCVFFVNNLSIDQIMSRVQSNESNNSRVLLDDAKLTQELYFSIWDYLKNDIPGGDYKLQPTSVISIAMACYAQILVMILAARVPDEYREIYNHLTRTDSECKSAQKLLQYGYITVNGLDYMSRMLMESTVFQKDPNELIYKTIIKGLLDLLFMTQNVANLPNREKLVRTFSLTYSGTPSLCNAFWTYDFEFDDNRSLLDATQRAFPLRFGDFCEMLCSLIADEESADYVFQYMSQLPSFADYCRESDYEPTMEVLNGNTVWRCIGNPLVFGAPNLVLKPQPGTEAFELSSQALLLKLRHSGWFLCLSFLDSFIHTTSTYDSAHKPHGTLEITTYILKLLSIFFDYADIETVAKFFQRLELAATQLSAYGSTAPDALASIVGEIMNRVSSPAALSLEAVSWCIGIMKNLVRHYPETIWKRLRAQRLLPHYGASVNSGYLQQGVIAVECQLGTYRTTISFLKLIKSLVLEAQNIITGPHAIENQFDIESVQSEILCSSLAFILREIFPLYSSWKYANVAEKYEIGYLIISIVKCILEDLSWYFAELDGSHDQTINRARSVQVLILQSFLDNPTTYQLSPLLEIIGIGDLQPMEYKYFGRRKEAMFLEDSIAEALLLLRTLLVVMLHRHDQVFGLEIAMLDRTVRRPDGSNREFIHIIASYIDYQNSDLFAQTATEVLTLLCALTSKSNRTATSFVGYFGADAFTMSSKFVELVNTKSMKSADSPLVQMTIYSFITAVAETQPGLCGFFLNGIESNAIASNESNTLQSDEIRESSILFPVINTIENWRDIAPSKAIILTSVAEFLLALWKKAGDHRSTLGKLRKKADFWSFIIQIVSNHDKIGQDDTQQLYFQLARSKLLKLLALEIINCKNSSEINSKFSDLHNAVMESLCGIHGPFGLENLYYDPTLTEETISLCKSIKPAVELKYFRRLVWNSFFEADRHSGKGYMYDSSLLSRKLNLPQNPTLIEAGNQILQKVEELNVVWFRTEQQLECAKVTVYVVKLMCTELWSTENPKLSMDSALSLLKNMITHINLAKSGSDVHIIFRNEISTAVLFLTKYVSKLGKSTDNLSVKLIRSVLGQMGDAFSTDYFPFGPFGQLSDFYFHHELLATELILLQTLQKFDLSDNKDDLKDIMTRNLPIICQGLKCVLSGPSTDGRDESLLLSVLFELTRKQGGISVATWMPLVERYQLLPLMLSAFSRWERTATSSLTCNPEQLLQVLLSFASHSLSASSMVANGIISNFCYNSFATEIMQGNVLPYLSIDGNKLHRIWILMISIVSSLTEHLGPDMRFLESVVGFIHVFQNQLCCSLNCYKNENLSLGRLEEVDRISGLFYRICVCVGICKKDAKNIDAPILNEILEPLLRNLALYVFLFKNPNEMKARIKPVSRREKALYEIELDGKLQVSAEFYSLVRKKMLVTCLRIIGSLIFYTNSESLLVTGHLDETTPSLFSPTLSSFQDYGATFGTLFDLLRHLAVQLKSEYDTSGGKSPSKEVINLVFGSEITLTTLSSQLKLFHQGEGEFGELKTEFQSIIADLNGLFKDAVKTWKQGPVQQARAYMLQIESSLK